MVSVRPFALVEMLFLPRLALFALMLERVNVTCPTGVSTPGKERRWEGYIDTSFELEDEDDGMNADYLANGLATNVH